MNVVWAAIAFIVVALGLADERAIRRERDAKEQAMADRILLHADRARRTP